MLKKVIKKLDSNKVLFILMVSCFFLLDIKAKCIVLKNLNLSENEIVTLKDKELILKDRVGKCIDGVLLKSLLKDINSLFMNKGFVTTKAYIKQQEIKDGRVEIDIVKGEIEDIISDDISSNSFLLDTAFIGQKKRLLNLRELETSLEMINRVPSVDAKFEIKPGKSHGKSIIDVEIKEKNPIHLTLGTSGTKPLNDNNLNLTAVLSVDNPLNLNDILTYTYNGSRIQEEYQSTKGSEVNYSVAVGSYLVEFIYSDTSYRQGIEGLDGIYLSNGKTLGKQFKVSKMLFRNQFNKFESSILLNHKNTKNYFENTLIEVSSYKTTQLELDLKHTFLQTWGSLITSYSYHNGLDWFGARGDQDSSIEENLVSNEKLLFKKHTLDIELAYYFAQRKYQFNPTFHLQYSDDLLYNNDQVSIGNTYSVRGYSFLNLIGNNGWYFKNDFLRHLNINLQDNLLKQLSIFLGFDYGKVKCESNNQNNCGEIYGSALGFKTISDGLSLDFTWSKPLKKLNQEFDSGVLFNFYITMEF